MLEKIEKYFKDHLHINEESSAENDERRLMISTTVLFLEMAYADFEISSEEEKKIKDTIQEFFTLEAGEIDELIGLAREERQQTNDIYGFTKLIHQHFSREQKIRILEKLWELIYADGTVDKYEDSLIRKITNLLGLDHQEMIQAKITAQRTNN